MDRGALWAIQSMGSQRVGHERIYLAHTHLVLKYNLYLYLYLYIYIYIGIYIYTYGVFLVAQIIKNPPVMRETWVRSPDWEDPLEKGMAIHSSILA